MNAAKYLTALENSIRKLHKLPDGNPAQNFEAVSELCDVLRLGKVEAVVSENEASEPAVNCLYDIGRSCESDCISERINTPDGMVIVYNIYPIEGEAMWTDEERSRISVFIAMLSNINGKSRLIKLAQRMTFYDSELNIYNLRQFMKCTAVLCKTGQIVQFTAVRFNLKHFSVINQTRIVK